MRPLSNSYIEAEAAYRQEMLAQSMRAAQASGRGATWRALRDMLHLSHRHSAPHSRITRATAE